jgi:hypothetical protein
MVLKTGITEANEIASRKIKVIIIKKINNIFFFSS